MIVNFFNSEQLITSFSKLYKIDSAVLQSLAHQAMQEEDPTLYFLERFRLELDTVDIKNVSLHCKHITTISDDFESFKKHGFLTLNEILTFDTPLRHFLNSRGIYFDILHRKVAYKGKEFTLYEGDQECQECFYNTECQYLESMFSKHETLSYRDMACTYRKAIKIFMSKIFYDKGEIEVHLSGSFDDVHKYSAVRRYPEILNTIERMINKLFDEKVTLSRDWTEKMKGKYYCLDFDVNIFKFETITSKPYYDDCWYTPYLEFCENECYSLDEVNPNFYGNLLLLNLGIEVIAGGCPTKCGQILPDMHIPFDDIKITAYSAE